MLAARADLLNVNHEFPVPSFPIDVRQALNGPEALNKLRIFRLYSSREPHRAVPLPLTPAGIAEVCAKERPDEWRGKMRAVLARKEPGRISPFHLLSISFSRCPGACSGCWGTPGESDRHALVRCHGLYPPLGRTLRNDVATVSRRRPRSAAIGPAVAGLHG